MQSQTEDNLRGLYPSDGLIFTLSQLPSRMLLGYEFVLRHNMELDLGRGLGSFEVKTKHGRARLNGRYGKREVGTRERVAGVQESIEAVGEEDIRDAIEAMDFAEFGDAEDHKALQEVLLEYRDVFRPTMSIVRGPDFSIKIQDDADIPRLNRAAFRKSLLAWKKKWKRPRCVLPPEPM
jgi:hypothetical protein